MEAGDQGLDEASFLRNSCIDEVDVELRVLVVDRLAHLVSRWPYEL